MQVKAKLGIVWLLAVIVVMAAGSSIFWVINQKRKMALTEEALLKAREVKKELPSYTFPYEIKDMSIPLTNHKHNRSAFAQFTLILDCPSEEAKKAVLTALPQLMNAILEVGSNYYVEDFGGPGAVKGFAKFKNELRESFVKYLGKYSPREVVLKDWFVN